ncbi:MAG: ammonium transporter [Gammaproteobacteria bacterium TMED281]|nr:MAG: ammonium transporter [Gammaproteobacteria bacterium TMED281]|tara:strand:+ start:7381 stop:8628 length:1248 start_codon:yes stop_codon:yes gene_type:complete
MEIGYALNTLYMLITAALVMWMAAGFTMLEAGLVRRKNTAEIVTKNIGLYSIACFMYLLCGYMVMYPGDVPAGTIVPAYDFSFGSTTADTVVDGYGYSESADFFFQVVFVATACSIVSGAVAERMNQWPFFALVVFIAAFIYPVQGFWNWGGGFLKQAGYSDFAGSGTVHLIGAACALAAAIFIGPRLGKYGKVSGKRYGLFPVAETKKLYGANIPIAALGTFVLWLGWFGFNGGSQLAIQDVENANAVAQVFLNTNMAAAGGVISCLVVARVFFKKTNIIYALNGAISGLVSITADPLSPSGYEATLIGAVGGLICYGALVVFEQFFKVDDPVGAISAHGAAGIFGVMVVPFTNAEATFGSQLYGVVSIVLWGFVLTYAFLFLLNLVAPVRASDEIQKKGLDAEEIGVEAYPEF